MSRLTALTPDKAAGSTKALLDAVRERMGMVPNIMSILGNSPAILTAYLGFNAGLRNSAIGSKLGELIALTVANENGCVYCNSVHSCIGKEIGLDAQTLEDARHGFSSDPKVNVALHFAKRMLIDVNTVSDAAIGEVKAAGYTEGEILEIIAEVSLNIFTNYVNIVSSTDPDYL